MIPRLLRRFRYFLHCRQMQRDLADEMAAHRAMMPADRRPAFGSEPRLREDTREVWVWTWLDQLRQDVVYAARTFVRSPGFTLSAVAILALGVGVNLADFQIYDALFHRLSIPGADSIFQVSRIAKRKQSAGVPYPAIQVYRENCTLCSYVVSENTSLEVTVEGESGLHANFVSGNYFSALRISPAWGRLLAERDDSPGAPAVAVLGYQYWKNSWAGDPAVVGRLVHMNGQIFRVVGVAPWDFDGLAPRRTAAWLPAVRRSMFVPGGPPPESFTRAENMLFARTRPGVPLAAMEAQLTSIGRSLASAAPMYFLPDERAVGYRLPGTGWDLKGMPPALLLIPGLVLLVLLSACANLGNMLLARGLARQREMSIRIFLGAGRARMIRQLMTENLLLAVFGGVAALVVGTLASAWLLRILGAPPDIRVSASWRSVCAGVALALLSVLAFGLPPALGIARPAHQSGRRRQFLVAVQVAVSCLLLISSAIIVRGAIRSATIDLAFDYRRMTAVDPQLYTEHLTPVVARQKLDALVERLGIAWHEMSGCPAQAILISLNEHAPASFHPGAMAYAMPYDGAHIVLFYDRIEASGHALLPHLMAHVMVHEITHILQGVDRHSEEGVMKAHWGQQDFNRMIGKSLDFTADDVEMIHNGPLARAARRNAASEPVLVAAR